MSSRLIRPALQLARRTATFLPVLALSGCGAGFRLFHPVGPVATTEWNTTLLSTGIMLLIIAPVTVLIFVFCWQYRKERNAKYDPHWSHSLPLELLMWGVPFLMVVALGVISYQTTMLVNPADPKALAQPPGAAGDPPLEVDVITTDWQWLFIYPAQHIATIDQLEVPAGREVRLRMTSATVTNDFYIPQVAPMMDVMPGMRTLDAFTVGKPGNYEGFSANFSGAGFSWMQFMTNIVPPAEFAAWVAKTQASPTRLDFNSFQKLAKPTINVDTKPSYFSQVSGKLWDQVYASIQNGKVYPVPEDLESKAPQPVPPQGKPGQVKVSS
jgi:cytochrome o ubiquinol oxidase subunit 2